MPVELLRAPRDEYQLRGVSETHVLELVQSFLAKKHEKTFTSTFIVTVKDASPSELDQDSIQDHLYEVIDGNHRKAALMRYRELTKEDYVTQVTCFVHSSLTADQAIGLGFTRTLEDSSCQRISDFDLVMIIKKILARQTTPLMNYGPIYESLLVTNDVSFNIIIYYVFLTKEFLFCL